ncbi:peptidase S8/S53 subtilisin kexin sedolisin [Natronococcus pandeyae]|uniref:Peptidase S8/S53 subtilisin kexin sedolisin n=1 Tax=Natronococcus pandeyae TaxID=2055836 RepID=A0A8J8TRD2_9EURY|nr:S8 family serine peptidase [Natronococcus pandeyae]TYL37855.1 peptidase S8/S53 subtilisin kexin sedolisin [Natronococcus pandeyae]
MSRNHTTRRNVLRTIGAAGVSLSFVGLASASDGQARYVAKTTGDAVESIEAAGFDVLAELAGGDVVLVKGGADETDDLGTVSGVSIAVRDFEVELESPVSVDADVQNGAARRAAGTVDGDEVYDEYLWDKQLQEVRAAHEYATGAGRTVAVLDTGVDASHPDLDVDTDRSVVITDGQPVPEVGDSGFHGTHVAGTIAGTGDVAMVGTAPDATLVSVRILGPETGTWGDILAGMAYAAEIGADAANMSIGTAPIPPQAHRDGYNRLLQSVANAVTRDGTLLVGSAGNSDANLQQEGYFTLPNSLSGVLSISATTPTDLKTYYSNYGTNEIGVGAPGGGYETAEKTLEGDEVEYPWPLNAVFSTVPEPGLLPAPYVDTTIDGETYAWLMGTSMAAPQVSGLAALVRERDPSAGARKVESAIAHGAESANGRSDHELGAGRINALRTVEDL